MTAFQTITADPAGALTDDVPVYDAHHMMPSGNQARIVLDGKVYTLRITRAGKLILTK